MRRFIGYGILAALLALSACGDSGGPGTPAEPSGQYALISVGTRFLPYEWDRYLDGSYEILERGSLRVLSRSRLFAATDIRRYNADSSLREIKIDTVVFSYRLRGDIVELEFFDPNGVRVDTLELTTYFDAPALRALSAHYIRLGSPTPLLRNALYAKQP